ncbi:MAG: DUF423 domain-containing protein [Plesiomonas sp.]
MTLRNLVLPLAAISGFFTVAFGAFGAHILSRMLMPEQMMLIQTGLNYQMFHTVAMLAAGIVSLQYAQKQFVYSGLLFALGILLFSGSLYGYALTQLSMLVWVTPLGGVSFLAGWLTLFTGLLRLRRTAHE